jgi:hypothetical protein
VFAVSYGWTNSLASPLTQLGIEHITRHSRRTLSFTLQPDEDRLIVDGETNRTPDYAVASYDADRDVAYRTPDLLSARDLEFESSIHFPEALVEHLGQRPLASSIGHLVLIQRHITVATRVSPLSALRALLGRVADVNMGLLHAENGALTFVRRAGASFEAHISAQSLETFLKLPKESREAHFPDFEALEILITGSDAMTSDPPSPLKFDLERVRCLSLSDVGETISVSENARREVHGREPLFAMQFATALMMLDIAQESVAS